MKRISTIILTVLVISLNIIPTKAQVSNEYSYNVNKAFECIQKNDYEQAKDLLKKELKDNPKSAIGYELIGHIFFVEQSYGNALTNFMQAIKYYPKKNKPGVARANAYLAKTYLCLEDTVSAINHFKEAVKNETDDFDYKSDLAEVYFDLRQYADAEAIYQQMIKDTPGRAYPYYGLARNAYSQKQYDKAKELVRKGQKLDGNSTTPNILMMRIYCLEKDYKSMLNESLTILSEDLLDNEAIDYLQLASDSIYQPTINALIKKSFEDKDNHVYWDFILGSIYQNHKDYRKAIRTFKPLVDENTDAKEDALERIIECYDELGDSRKVIELCNIGIVTNPDDYMLYYNKANAEFYQHELDAAKKDYEKMMELNKSTGYFGYYRLGWIEEVKGNFEEALELYDKGIALKEDYAYTYMMKGMLLKERLNRQEEAKDAFMKCIELDLGKIEEGTCRQYAYVGLGEYDKAIAVVDSLLAGKPDDAGTYYDAACVYSRMKNAEKALEYLEKCFEKGYSHIPHVLQDDDMDLIRGTEKFKGLIEKYSKLYEVDIEGSSAFESEQNIVMHEIPIAKQTGNTYLIKASINDLPMDFILDTGCSDISLSSVESEFMLKNGYLKQSDLKGSSRYTNATGEVHTAKEIIVREIRIGDLVLHNLKASIIPNQKAPLLLGQNVLTKFGKVEIDYKEQKLRIGVVGSDKK